MARPLRIEYSGALYHVTSRGNDLGDIFLNDSDRNIWLQLFADVCMRYKWLCHSYCLMTNHYHIVIETTDANLSKGMRHLNGVYTQKFNYHHNHVGHVFQGRYKAILVEKESYLLELCRYVILNPVRAGMTKFPDEWAWTSYSAICGRAEAKQWLVVEQLLHLLGTSRKDSIVAYIDYIAGGLSSDPIWDDLTNQIFLGGDTFVDQHQMMLEDGGDLSEIPLPQQKPAQKPLTYFSQIYPKQKEAMAQAFLSGHYSMKAIGQFFGVHYSTVSRAVRNFENEKSD